MSEKVTNGKKIYAKKSWNLEETRLLKWAVKKYTSQRQIPHFKLVEIHPLIQLLFLDNE